MNLRFPEKGESEPATETSICPEKRDPVRRLVQRSSVLSRLGGALAATPGPGAPVARPYYGSRFRFASIPTTGNAMAIYRSLYYGDVVVGVGGRITIPQEMRDDIGIVEGDMLRIRVEASNGSRQLVIWRSEDQPDNG